MDDIFGVSTYQQLDGRFLPSKVQTRIAAELGPSSSLILDVPKWLLLNSCRTPVQIRGETVVASGQQWSTFANWKIIGFTGESSVHGHFPWIGVSYQRVSNFEKMGHRNSDTICFFKLTGPCWGVTC